MLQMLQNVAKQLGDLSQIPRSHVITNFIIPRALERHETKRNECVASVMHYG